MRRIATSAIVLAVGAVVALPTMLKATPPEATDDTVVMESATPVMDFEPNEWVVPQGDTGLAQATLTRMQRWQGSWNGCMTQATPQERAMTQSLEYTCACLATYIVNLCAPTDFTTNEQVLSCTTVNNAGILAMSATCMSYGPLQIVTY